MVFTRLSTAEYRGLALPKLRLGTGVDMALGALLLPVVGLATLSHVGLVRADLAMLHDAVHSLNVVACGVGE